MDLSQEQYIRDYPFLQYINEDKSRYKHAKDCGYNDPYDLFLIGDSGGFLLNINPGDKFVDTYLLTQMADTFRKEKVYTTYKVNQDVMKSGRYTPANVVLNKQSKLFTSQTLISQIQADNEIIKSLLFELS